MCSLMFARARNKWDSTNAHALNNGSVPCALLHIESGSVQNGVETFDWSYWTARKYRMYVMQYRSLLGYNSEYLAAKSIDMILLY